MPSSRTLLLAGIAVVALALGIVAGRSWQSHQPLPLAAATRLPAPRPLPAFALMSGDNALQAADLAGRWSVLFFGFTNCPDVCPTTLALLAKAMRGFADLPVERRPRVVFISVDPARDTAGRALEYARWYDADFVGATGSETELAALAGALGAPYAPYARGTPDPVGEYSVDHSGALFILDPQVRFVAVMTPPLDAVALQVDLRALLEEDR